MRDDQTLLGDMRRGDATALADLYERYKDDLLTVARCLLADRAAAEDCLHDTIVGLAAGIHDFRLRGNLRSYLAACVANRARDRLRRQGRQVSLTACEHDLKSRSADGDPVESLANRERDDRLRAALACLPYEQREAVTLHLHGQLTFREVSRHQRVSINTAHSRYRYAIDKLRTLLRSDKTIAPPNQEHGSTE